MSRGRRGRRASTGCAWLGVLLTILLAPTLVMLLFSSSLPGTAVQADQPEGRGAAVAAASGAAREQQQQQQQQEQQGQQAQLQQSHGQADPGGLRAAAATAAATRQAGKATGVARQAAARAQQQQRRPEVGAQASPGQIAQQQAAQRQRQRELGQRGAAADGQGEQQQQPSEQSPFRETVVQKRYTGPFPRWPSTLARGKGASRRRPGCADRDAPAQCAAWAGRGDCDANPAYMYQRCADSCGLCAVVYLHGNETRREVEVAPGVLMPMVGYGTAGLGDLTADGVYTAIRTGYRLVDSAQAREWYQEDLVGHGWSQSGIKREHLFITTKQHPRHHGYWTTLQRFKRSLQDLQTAYVDMLLLHYPACWGDLCGSKAPEGTWQDSWAALEQLVREGKLRAIGVSNFDLAQMAELVGIAEIKPAVLQANSDLLRQNRELQALCARHGIQFQAYSSLGGQWLARAGGRNPVLDQPALTAIARRLNRTAGQVALRWALQSGQAVIPRTSKPRRMAENLQIFSFDLTDEDMLALDALDGADPAAAAAAGGGSAGTQRRRAA